jgi:diacylglycerol kinase family enzyme
MPGTLIVNQRSGGSDAADALVRAAGERGIAVHVLKESDDPAEAARAAPDGPLGMAGGDGSLAAVADVAIERDVPFVVVPLGTRNHFARDVGLDRDDPVAALDSFDGDERRVDVGRAGERPFLNNTSLGVYARLVHHRERHRRRRDALARARALVLAVAHRHETAFTVDGDPVVTRAILVANNHYDLTLFNLGERRTLDSGELHLSIAHGLLPNTWEERAGRSFTVDTARHRAVVALDGEPAALTTPLEFRSEPGALRLLLPPRS